MFVYRFSLLSADQNNYIISKYDMVKDIVRTVLQIIAMVVFKSIIIYLIIRTCLTVLTSFILARRAERDYPEINRREELSEVEKKDIFQMIRSGLIYKLSAILLNSTDNILISVLTETVMVGLLSNYVTISNGISSFYIIVLTSMIAGIGNLYVTQSGGKSREIFEIMCFAASWLGAVIAACYFSLASDFVTLWLGKRCVMNNYVVLSKAMMLFVSCSMNPIFSFREAFGLYKKSKYAILAAAAVNNLLSIV